MSTFPLHQVFLDNIFDRLEESSNIIIDFKVCKPADQTQTADDFKITSVNGFTSDSEFSDHLHLLAEEVVQKVVEKVPGLSNGLVVPFVIDAHKRLERLQQIVRKERYLANDAAHPDVWVFANPVFQCPDLHGLPSWMKHHVVHRVNCFAWVWRKIIRSFLDDLKFIAAFYKYNVHHLNQEDQAKIARLKLQLNIPVAQYSCFMWAASKLNIMLCNSASELIRIAAAICHTQKAPEISSKSLRNHFDNPSPETIRATIIDLQRIMQVLRVSVSLKATASIR